MKNFKLTLVITSLVGLNFLSCDDFLDRRPEGEVATTEELGVGGLEAQVFGIYSLLRTTSVGSWNRHWFGSIRSDDAAKGSTPGDSAANGTVFNDFQYASGNGLSTGWWNGHYQVIFACNEVINTVVDDNLTDEGSIVNEAEARAIRALMYFELRRDYGEVPIILATIDEVTDAIAPKSTVEAIDELILEDLKYAEEHLPSNWTTHPGRSTSGFAKSLMAKLYLYQEEWALSLEKSQEVINSAEYALMTSLADLFEQEGDAGSESVFEIQQLRTDSQSFNNIYYISQGVRGTGVWNLGWGFNVPTQELVDAFEDGDAREANTILVSGQDDGGFGGGILPDTPPLAQQYWNRKAYTRAATRNSYPGNANRWENIRIIRYADVLLMAAEAANEMGQTGTAIPFINQIRSRAGLADTTASSQAAVRDAIKQERRVEFAMEESRFYDLVRWGDATSVLSSLGYEARHALFPIPQEAIDQSGGVLIQNPDY